MTSELTRLLDGGAETLSSWLPAELRTVLDDGAHLMTTCMEKNQMTELSGVIVLAGLYITGIVIIGIMLSSFTSSAQK